MKFNNLLSQRRGVLEGALGASVILAAGVGVGLYLLHQRHEKELGKLEKDTVITCLDFAAEHYEGVIRRDRKAAADNKAAFVEPAFKTPCSHEIHTSEDDYDGIIEP